MYSFYWKKINVKVYFFQKHIKISSQDFHVVQ